MKPKVVITHWVHREVIDSLSETCEVIPNPTRETLSNNEILLRARDASALMTFMPDCVDAAFLDACPDLRIVSGAFKGYDNMDVDACTERDVWLTIVPDLLTNPTAELTHGLMIALGRNALPSCQYLRAGKFPGWEPRFYGRGIDSSVVGIAGMGAVGQALAKKLSGYEAEIIYYDPKRLLSDIERRLGVHSVELGELLTRSDFVVSVLPLNESTLHLFNDQTLASMKPGAYLINTGRGSTVDESAVARALESGHLAGYAADVFEFEDWARGDRPRTIPPELIANQAQTVFTTHIGSAVDSIRRDIAMEAACNIVEALHGKTPHGAVNLLPCSDAP